jgi:hypothetical protein
MAEEQTKQTPKPVVAALKFTLKRPVKVRGVEYKALDFREPIFADWEAIMFNPHMDDDDKMPELMSALSLNELRVEDFDELNGADYQEIMVQLGEWLGDAKQVKCDEQDDRWEFALDVPFTVDGEVKQSIGFLKPKGRHLRKIILNNKIAAPQKVLRMIKACAIGLAPDQLGPMSNADTRKAIKLISDFLAPEEAQI